MTSNCITFIILLNVQYLDLSSAVSCFDYYTNAINQLQPYQLTVFSINNQKTFLSKTEANFFRTLRHLPHVTVDIENMFSEKNSFSVKSSVNNSKYLSLNIILTDKNFYRSIFSKSIIDFLAKFCPIEPRQKILLIFLMKNTTLSDTFLKEVFEYTWLKKFLDFTIISQKENIFHDTACTIQHYNPFKKEISKEKMDCKTKLFPNKISNVFQYTIKLGVISNDSITVKIRDSSNKIINIETEKYYLLSLALKKLNFLNQFNEVGINETFLNGSRIIDKKLANNEINIYVKPRNFVVTNEHILVDIENDCEKMLAIVPKKSVKTKVLISIEVIIKFGFLPIIIVFIYITIRILKIKHKKWELFGIIQVFFGMSTTRPTIDADRILYVFTIVVSAIFSIDFYSNFLGIGVTRNEDLFKTIKDINDSTLKIFAFKGSFNDTFSESDIYGQSIKSRTEVLSDTVPCIEELALRDDRICIVREGLLIAAVNYHPMLRNRVFNIAKPIFNCLKIQYSFEKSSPYAKKFISIFRYIHESGINHLLESKWKKKVFTKKMKEQKNVNFFLASLISIQFLGYTVSIIIFFSEYFKRAKVNQFVQK